MHRKSGYITRQAKRLSDGEINRRRFVMSALSAGVTMPTALSLASKAEARQPKQGGLLRVATGDGSPFQPDLSEASNGFSSLLAFAQGNCLTERTAKGDLVGELAESFKASADHTVWHFTLRRDVLFHSGQPLAVSDVITSLARERARLPHMVDLRPDGSRRITITLDRPDIHFAHRLADPAFVVTSQNEHAMTGAYRLDHAQDGHRVHLVRTPEYWKPGRGFFDAVEIVALPGLAARQMAVMAGDVDYADQIDPRGLALLQRAPGIEILETRQARVLTLGAERQEPLEHIAPALPCQAIVEQILLGHGTAAQTVTGAGTPMPLSPIRLAVHDTGVPRTMEAARLIAAGLGQNGIATDIVDPEQADPNAIHIKWQRNALAETKTPQIVVLWASDLAAHSIALSHGDVATDHENDGARLIERWWFA